MERALWLSDLKQPSFAKLTEKWILDSSTPLSKESFTEWALQQWDPQASVEELQRVLSTLYQESFPHKTLTLETWIDYLQGLLLKPFSRPEAPKENSIHCADLSFTIPSVEVTHRLFLGLTDKAFSLSRSPILLEKDILRFMEMLGGLDFPLVEEEYLEFEFHWIREMPARKSFYCFSESDFLGELQVPFRFWLEKGPEKPSPPALCRWDRLQQNLQPLTLQAMRGTDEAYGNQLLNALAMERGQKPFEPFGQNPKKSFSLSVSRLNAYEKCPFIFAAEKLFRLRETRPWDMTLDYLTSGQLLHAFLEVLSEKPLHPKPSPTEMGACIETCFEKALEKTALNYIPKGLKESLKKRYHTLAHRFFNMEETWNEHHPQKQRALVREGAFSFFLSPLPPFIRKERTQPEDIEFRGRMDRLDLDEEGKRAMVLDYKNSSHRLNNVKNWMKKQEDSIQLLVYTLVVEKGFLPMNEKTPKEVVAGLYYVVKEQNMKKGFIVKERADTLLDMTLYKKTRSLCITQKEKQKMLSKLETYLMEKVQEMQKGHFTPRPHDEKQCPKCTWRRLCRGHHLNG